MKPLAVDFAPPQRLPRRLRWFAGGAGALLLVVSSAVWLLTPTAEAGHMEAAGARPLPGFDEAQSVDAAVRSLNFPWQVALDALENGFDSPHDGSLLGVDADMKRGVVKVNGEARDAAIVLSLPQRLRDSAAIAEATLLGLEMQREAAPLPVRFTLELRLREAS